MFTKVLIANRGEIAIRITRALRELNITSVAVYSEADREALHVHHADEAYLIGPPPSVESYLNIDRILEAAQRSGAEAIHPGYGFLAENSNFAQRCEESNVTFIGPPAAAIEAMGSKTAARQLMDNAGVPVVPGTIDPVATVEAAAQEAEKIGYPIAVKAVGGGGGKGFRVANGPDELESAFTGASREGEQFFSNPEVYLERYLRNPRHIEVQVIADNFGNIVHLGERDCSIQRRHQKLIEESPAPAVNDEFRQKIGEIAINAARAVGYRSAGTVEGLMDGSHYYFMEMNTRVQVEHPVTEMVTGIDIVKEQIRLAAGKKLSFSQSDVRFFGHAIECRINAEDASKGFVPKPGLIEEYEEPAGPGIRVDSGVQAQTEITPFYDSLIAKLIVWDRDRDQATDRMLRALSEYQIEGISTLINFHKALLETKQWHNAETCHDLIADKQWLSQIKPASEIQIGEKKGETKREYTIEVDGQRFEVKIALPESVNVQPNPVQSKSPTAQPQPSEQPHSADQNELTSPLQGKILKIAIEPGTTVNAGDLICVIEAMKMENEITAHKPGTVTKLPITVGGSVMPGDTIAVINSA